MIRRFLEAGYPCLYTTTFETHRAIDSYLEEIKKINEDEKEYAEKDRDKPYEAYRWDLDAGIFNLLTNEPVVEAITMRRGETDVNITVDNPLYPIKFLSNKQSNVVIFLPNYELFIGGKVPNINHAIVNDYMRWKDESKCIVILSPQYKASTELDRLFQLIDFPLPDEDHIKTIMSDILPDDYVNPDYDPADKKSQQFKIEFRDDAIRAAKGMTSIEIENALSLSLIEEDDFDPLVIAKIKQQQIKKSATLEISTETHKFEDIIGLVNLQPYLIKVAMHPLAQGVLIVGPPGCIAGDSIVRFNRGNRNSGRPITIEDAYYKFNEIPRSNGRSGSQYLWDNRVSTRVPSWLEDGIGYNEIRDIIYSGKKEVWEVKTETGKSIKVTEDHPFMVPGPNDSEEFASLEDIDVGDVVFCRNMDNKRIRPEKDFLPRKEIHTKYHPYGGMRRIGKYKYKRNKRYRLVIEAEMNSLRLEEFVYILNNDEERSKTFEYLSPKVVVHHKDGNTLNDRRDNLEILESVAHHNRKHRYSETSFDPNAYINEERIAKVVYCGIENTYDVVMYDPYRNFVANEFVLHNCGKTYIGEALGNELGIITIIVSFERIMAAGGGIVGQAQAQAIQTFKTINALAPAVVVFDEIEKGLAGIESSGRSDAGTKAGVGSEFLKWIEKKTPGIYVLATSNEIDSLPAAFKRAGRWDAIIGVDLPTTKECIANLEYYGKKFLDEDAYEDMEEMLEEDNAKLIDDLDGYSHAELMTIVKQMTMLDCDIKDAMKWIKPIKNVDPDGIARIRTWIKNNAVPASELRTLPALRKKAKEVLDDRKIKRSIKKKKKKPRPKAA